ncbi:MAG: hypothetical protein ACXW3M_14315 [Rhodoplanes sp.]
MPDEEGQAAGMLAQLGKGLREAARLVFAGLRVLWLLAWSALRPVLVMALQVLAALILLFEEWGWKPLSEALAWFARFRIIARLEALIMQLPPYAALFVFALPTAILFPLKLLAVWLLANEQFAAATGLFIGAKVASTALVARLFMLTRPALMQIAWFANAYNRFMPWKDRLFAQIRASWVWRYGRMVKTRVRLAIGRAWAKWRPEVQARAVALRAWLRATWDGYFGSRT